MRVVWGLLLVVMGCSGAPTRPPARPAPTLPDATVSSTPPVDPAQRSPYGTEARPEALGDLLGDPGPQPLRVHMIDIGQGDALLIESPSGKWILLDTGPRGGRKALLQYLRDRGVKQLTMAVASHAHSDHIASMDQVIERHRPPILLDSGVPHTTRDYARLLDAVERTKVQLKIARKGRQITLDPGVVLHLLGPEEPLVAGSRSDLNANSVVFRLQYDQFSMLFTGDAEEETEHRLLKDPQALKATVLKVAHHGSRHATTPGFLAAVGPRIAFVSAAKSNRYGHPAPETMNRLRAAGVTIFDTPTYGDVVLSTNGKRLSLHVEKTAPVAGAVAAAPPEAGHPPPAVVAAAPAGGGVDINTADAAALIKLPGVGKATAKRIIDYRTTHGPFRTVDDLVKVRGIGKKTLAKLRPLITVSPPPGA